MLEAHEKLMAYCTACPRLCQSACPVSMTSGNESFSPWGLMQTMNMVRKGEIPFNEEVAALAYQCTTCRACTTQCDHLNVIPPVLHEVRVEAVKKEIAPPAISGFLTKFHRYNNPFARDLSQKMKSILPAPYLEKDYSTVYFPSCTTIAKCPDIIRDTFQLFEKLRINFVGAYPEAVQCCGYPLIAAGMEDEFLDVAELNFHALKKYKTVICGSPACVYTLRETYKKYAFGLGKRIVTVNQFLDPYLHNINYRIKKNIRTKLMYHDPCYSCRYLNEVDLPRELIGLVSGHEPIEFFKHREQTACSGQGGCYSVVSKSTSDEIARRRLEEVGDRNVQMLVTQCPSCVHKFRKNSERLIVKDLVSYLNDCIEGTAEE